MMILISLLDFCKLLFHIFVALQYRYIFFYQNLLLTF
uniref:Uncharacterized protein n=1 Tax=Arundo donax TaxID=35708 RepID=A0A0A9AW13_ARUDO